MSLFDKLFKSNREVSDGWNQAQREALVDLLVLSMYVDSNLSLSEENVIQAQVDSFQWQGATPVEYYVDNTFNRVRSLKTSEESVNELLSSIAERLNDYEARQTATGICERLITSDGKEPSEKAYLDKVKSAFNTQ